MIHIQCNKHFQSQYAYIKNKLIEIGDYIHNENKYKNKIIKCANNHELILAKGKIVKPYFRHKFDGDVDDHPMTLWHSEWQGYFPKTEIEFKKKNSDQVKNRRADVCLNEKTNIELQHSKITKEEIDNRKKDYQLHKKDIIWIIHGDESNINIVKRNDSSTYLHFISDHWKHESFTSYDSIYIDINKNIYKINPNKVKSYMIDVENSIEKDKFIDSLKNNINLWSKEEPSQFKLYINQQGAGNGKTYSIINMLQDDDKLHYKYFIFVTKQHSAKYVIKEQFYERYVKNKDNKLTYIIDVNINEDNKKYIISYRNSKNNKNYQMIIATIDSLMYSIGNKNSSEYEKFIGIVNSIIDDYIRTDKQGKIKFAGIDPKLNKEILLILDEAQDLAVNYAEAIINIMRHKYIDAYIVGDKLQSISNEPNSFTYLIDNHFPDINTIKLPQTNICRRFTNSKLVHFVNELVPFQKYDLPIIQPSEINSKDDNSLHFFDGQTIYAMDSDDKINIEIDKIMNYFKNEVDENNRKPNDFLIITPFTKNNPLVNALQLAIDMYWKQKIGNNTEEYIRYAIFHKSEDGNTIDLDESKNSTRIVSIHSSKGDGRPIVFVIGLNEGAIKICSNHQKDNLIYNSLIHVAFTRMKEKLYIRYENNNDDIAQKLNKYRYNNDFDNTIEPKFYISNSIKYGNVIDGSNNKSYIEFKKIIIDKINLEKIEDPKDEKRIVDMGNHLIRYASLFINIQIEIMNKEIKNDDRFKKQIIAKWQEICESDITKANDWKIYNSQINKNNLSVIRLSDIGSDYKKYFNIIYDNMINIKNKLTKIKKNIPVLCPFECVILHYMLQIKQNGKYADTTINDIYNIIDVYNHSFSISPDGHDECLCKTHFNTEFEHTSTNINKMKDYLHNHFDKVKDIKNTLKIFHEKYPKISWLINHHVSYNGNNENYKLWKEKFQLIGYDDENIIIGYVKPQFNQLNYNEVLMNSIFDTYLVSNVKKDQENYKRFNGKKIKTVVFSLDHKEPYYIDWENQIDNNLLKNTIYEYLKEDYITENNSIYYFYKYWRQNCPENEKNPNDFVNFLIDQYKKNKDDYQEKKGQFPIYIDEFLSMIKFKIENAKKKERNIILLDYEDKNIFFDDLNNKLCSSLKRYLGIKEDDSDNEDDED